MVNPLTPNDHYSSHTAPLTSKRCILHIYSTNIFTEHFKHCIYSPVFSSSKCSLFHNSNIFGSCIIHILYTRCAKIKKKIIIPAPKGKLTQQHSPETTPILALQNRRRIFIGSISNMSLMLSTQKLLNGSGQIVTYKRLIKKKSWK